MDEIQRKNSFQVLPLVKFEENSLLIYGLPILHLHSLIYGSPILASIHLENQCYNLRSHCLSIHLVLYPEIWGGGSCYWIPWEQSLLIQSSYSRFFLEDQRRLCSQGTLHNRFYSRRKNDFIIIIMLLVYMCYM